MVECHLFRSRVIKHLDLIKNGLLSLRSGCIAFMAAQLGFQGLKKAFSRGIIPAIAFTAHAAENSC